MSESWFYSVPTAGTLSRGATLDAFLAAAEDGTFLWLHDGRPTNEELSSLIDPLGLHPLSVEDCFDNNYLLKRLETRRRRGGRSAR